MAIIPIAILLLFIALTFARRKTRNRAGQQAFRLATVSVIRADYVFRAFYRRMKSRLGPTQATVATAHLIARVGLPHVKVSSGI